MYVGNINIEAPTLPTFPDTSSATYRNINATKSTAHKLKFGIRRCYQLNSADLGLSETVLCTKKELLKALTTTPKPYTSTQQDKLYSENFHVQ